MTLLFLRIIPAITAFFSFLAALWQWVHPLNYPWPLVWFGVWVVFASFILVWRHLSWRDALDKLIPFFITLLSLGLGFLVVGSFFGRLVLTALFIGIPYFILELLFLLIHAPARYPVNGLSRFNIALVPVATLFFAASLNGLNVGLRLPWWIITGAFCIFGAALFFFTAHPTASRVHRLRWSALGGLVGAHIGILEWVLPLSMFAQGALAAFLLFVPLRFRRYLYQPQPARRVAWSESVLASVCFLVILISARWI
ncbi:MAG: hypothetical protein Q7N87_03630 [Candidatus Uhrbacteria bacterium]|nr:hypothetical protein [Candidatus Uhrbacteria bacterium]